jgi:hypothetical protein
MLNRGRFVERMITMLNASFWCDNHSHEFGHTLLCCLSLTEMFIKQKLVCWKMLILCCSFRCDQICNHHSCDIGHTDVLLKSDLDVEPAEVGLILVYTMANRAKLVHFKEQIK